MFPGTVWLTNSSIDLYPRKESMASTSFSLGPMWRGAKVSRGLKIDVEEWVGGKRVQ
jgi:hypothetical protein